MGPLCIPLPESQVSLLKVGPNHRHIDDLTFAELLLLLLCQEILWEYHSKRHKELVMASTSVSKCQGLLYDLGYRISSQCNVHCWCLMEKYRLSKCPECTTLQTFVLEYYRSRVWPRSVQKIKNIDCTDSTGHIEKTKTLIIG